MVPEDWEPICVRSDCNAFAVTGRGLGGIIVIYDALVSSRFPLHGCIDVQQVDPKRKKMLIERSAAHHIIMSALYEGTLKQLAFSFICPFLRYLVG